MNGTQLAYGASAMNKASILFLLLTATAPLACSSKVSSTNDPTAAAPVPLDQFCTTYANEICDTLAPCCKAASLPTDTAKCKANLVAMCQTSVGKMQARGDTYDAKQGGVCIAAFGAEIDNCKEKPRTDPAYDAAEHSCDGVFKGTVAVGGSCDTSNDCAQPASGSDKVHCVFSSSSGGPAPTTGVCTLEHLAAAGEACGSTSTGGGYVSCSTGLTCKYDSSGKGTCTAPGAKGAACDFATDCQTGLACSPDTHQCSDPAPIGGKCTYGSSACVDGAYCDTTTSSCAAKKAAGATCEMSSECISGSCKGTCQAGGDGIATVDACAGNIFGSSSSSGGTADAGTD